MLRGRRILFVLPSLQLGGAERQALMLAKHLCQVQGAQVQVLGLAGGERVDELSRSFGLTTSVFPFRLWTGRLDLVRQLVGFARALRRARIEVLLPYVLLPNLVCGSVWRWTGVRTCIWQQRDEGVGHGPWILELAATRWMPWFVANSTNGAEYLRQRHRVPAGKIRVIANGVELPPPLHSRAEWRRNLGLSERAFVACMVANLTTNKDHETLLAGWRHVLDRTSSSFETPTLLLAGRLDENEHRIKAQAYDLALGQSVRFLGPVKDVAGLLSAVELSVFSSRREGCPNGVLEAMAAGLPVVATDIPGIRAALGPGAELWLAPSGDAETMAGRVLTALSQSALRLEWGAQLRQRVAMEFAPERMCCEMVSLIATALDNRPPQGSIW
jgi:glycosyltransferase involved in cell wall biosynthesis